MLLSLSLSLSLSLILTHKSQIIHNTVRRPIRPQRDSRKAAPQPSRITPSLHLPPTDNLVLVRAQPHHRLDPVRRPVRLRAGIPRRSGVWLAPRKRRSSSFLWHAPRRSEGCDKVVGGASVYISFVQWHKASGVGCWRWVCEQDSDENWVGGGWVVGCFCVGSGFYVKALLLLRNGRMIEQV